MSSVKKAKKKAGTLDYGMKGRVKMNFAAEEAYRFLRTNIEFSLSTGQEHAVFGVTSSMKGEGKSTTSLNIAYTLADSGKRVLLLEADMRLPVLAKRLNVPSAKGLSDILAGTVQPGKAAYKLPDNENLYFIQAGTIPPNPSELLGSERMMKLLSVLRQSFDYVVVDLPPVQMVADALVVGKKIDGLVVVVRQDYADRRLLDDTVRQIQSIDAKILGFVMTYGKTSGGKYGKYGKYKKYQEYSKEK